MKKSKLTTKRCFQGVVVSVKQTKTITVKVDRIKIHPIYKKRFVISKKYAVHDSKQQYKLGDKVKFVDCRPISKNKKWRVIYKVDKI